MTDFDSIDDVAARLAQVSYIADRELATTVYLAQALQKPLLLEGEAGVGKTELGQGAGRRPRRAADPVAVLRGHRRLAGAV